MLLSQVGSERDDRPLGRGEAEWVAAAISGDDDAFASIVSRYKGRVFATASRFAKNQHELDDLCQDVFVRVWKGLPKFRGDAPLEHWIMRLATRACYDFLRKETRYRSRYVSTGTEGEGSFAVSRAEDTAAGDARGAAEVLQVAMRRLKPKDQLILTLLEIEERPVREVAGLTGWSESNVKVRAFRARNRLRTVLEEGRGTI